MSLLSFNKFKDLLFSKKYGIVKAYCINNNCKYIEIKTPLHKKTFIVYVPDVYKMVVNDKILTVNIKTPSAGKNPQYDYIELIKDNLFDGDIVCISGSHICYVSSSEVIRRHKYGVDQEVEDEPEVDPIEKIIEDTKDVLKRAMVPKNVKLVKGKNSPTKKLNIVIKTEDGKEISPDSDMGKILIDTKNPTEIVVEDPVDERVNIDDDNIETSNDVNIIDKNVEIGMVYIAIEIGELFKKINNYEEECLDKYLHIDSGEKMIREQRIQDLYTLFESSKEKLRLTVQKNIRDDEIAKEQIEKLSIILLRMKNLKIDILTMTEKNPEVSIDEVDKTIRKTQETIEELNLKRLMVRDNIENIINDYRERLTS